MSKNSTTRSKATGFSLFELLIVLVIASMAFGLAGAFVGDSLSKAEGRAAARRLAATLRYARSQAVARSESYAVSFDHQARTYRTLGGDQEESLPEGWSFSQLKGVEEDRSGLVGVVFYPDGSSSGGEIRIERKEKMFQIKVDPLLGNVTTGEG